MYFNSHLKTKKTKQNKNKQKNKKKTTENISSLIVWVSEAERHYYTLCLISGYKITGQRYYFLYWRYYGIHYSLVYIVLSFVIAETLTN